MNNTKDFVIEAHDKYGECLADKGINNKNSNREKPAGFVEIFEIDKDNQKQLIGKHNLVVYQGREWLLSKAFGTPNINISPAYDEFICWFGAGTGGCPIGDPINPTSPTTFDTDLDTPVMLNATDVTFADYRLTPDEGYYKTPFDSLTFQQDSDNYNSWLIMKVSVTLTVGDGNGFNLNEAGLYTAASSAALYTGPFNLYARITFPSIVKTSSRQLLFVWYVYF